VKKLRLEKEKKRLETSRYYKSTIKFAF